MWPFYHTSNQNMKMLNERLMKKASHLAAMTGKLIYVGKCLGYGIPFSAQFTNPEVIVEGDKAMGYDMPGVLNYLTVLPQADPNGLFMPTSSSATWLIMIDPSNNEPRPVYFEPTIVVSPFLLPESAVASDYSQAERTN